MSKCCHPCNPLLKLCNPHNAKLKLQAIRWSNEMFLRGTLKPLVKDSSPLCESDNWGARAGGSRHFYGELLISLRRKLDGYRAVCDIEKGLTTWARSSLWMLSCFQASVSTQELQCASPTVLLVSLRTCAENYTQDIQTWNLKFFSAGRGGKTNKNQTMTALPSNINQPPAGRDRDGADREVEGSAGERVAVVRRALVRVRISLSSLWTWNHTVKHPSTGLTRWLSQSTITQKTLTIAATVYSRLLSVLK